MQTQLPIPLGRLGVREIFRRIILESGYSKKRADLIISGSYVLTMRGEECIRNGGVVVKGDSILEIGPVEEMLDLYETNRDIRLNNHLIMPGLINTHTHAAMTLFRGLADDLPLMEWLNNYIFPAEKHMNAELVNLGTRLACLEMIRSGTTTFKDMYLFEDAVAEAVAYCGIRGVVGEVLYDFPSPNYGPPEAGLEYTQMLIEKWKNHPLVKIAVEPHSAYLCSPGLLKNANDMAIDNGCMLILHLSETRDEVNTIWERYHQTPVKHLEQLGILGPHLLGVHSVWVDDEDIDILAKHHVKVSHCPESNMKLASGVSPVPKMIRAGICVGIGTDGCASNNNLDIFCEMDIAAKLHKVFTGDPTALNAQTTLEMATIRAAEALGLSSEIGSLEKGKRADIIALNLDQPHLTPMYNIPSLLVYAASGMDVDTVIINGKILLQDEKFTACNPQEILTESNKWAERIRQEILRS